MLDADSSPNWGFSCFSCVAAIWGLGGAEGGVGEKAGFAGGGSLAWVPHEGLWCQPGDNCNSFLFEPNGFI